MSQKTKSDKRYSWLIHQEKHFVATIALLAGAYFLISVISTNVQLAIEKTTKIWFLISILVPVIHQWFVALIWRIELYYNLTTRIMGKLAIPMYLTTFFSLFLFRFISITILAFYDKDSLDANTIFLFVITVIFTIPIIWTIYSTRKYFGMKRAAGLDHFDKSYRNLPLVKEGIYKYTDNAMYTFAMLAVFIPGLLLNSIMAIISGLFSYIYIWVHYHFTEKPDMDYIYG